MASDLRWAHKLTGYKDPLKASLVRAIYDLAKRILSESTTKKEPITPNHLKKLARKFGHNGATLSDLRLLFICTLRPSSDDEPKMSQTYSFAFFYS